MLLAGADRNVKENLFPKMCFILYSESGGKKTQNPTKYHCVSLNILNYVGSIKISNF